MAPIHIPRPQPDEHAPYFSRYIDRVPGDDAFAALTAQADETRRLLAPLDEARAAHRYAEGKWSVKEVVGHLTDAERVFALRALWFARGDASPLPGFDENVWAPAGGFDARPLADLLDEFGAVRAATRALFGGLPPGALARRGVANGIPTTPRAVAWIIAGHERHHLGVLRERYGIG